MNYEFEIRITSWDIENIINKIILKDKYILCKELGKENKNEHVHILLFTECSLQTLQQRLKRNFPKKYKISTVKDTFKYIKYIHKDFSEENQNIITNILMKHEHYYWKNLWDKDGDNLIKCRNKDTQNIVLEIIKTFDNKKMELNENNLKIIFNIFIKHNGLIPHKTYWNQVIRTVMFKRNTLDVCNTFSLLQEGVWNNNLNVP